MEAAMKVKSGQLDYYIGACNTGAGAAPISRTCVFQ
ncbi:Hypothetical protein Asd1617_04890 [Shigella dysenteriae 1617]|uniref:Uncharacterized protein n=1 Tax=Shigella dysenteriae 1617 TaxID=754093 RepID=A0A0A7A0F8_SHIDY|nr:Hypothetical protein Asd1617_04890 [Shigella dysenteriae 1617]